MKGLKAVLQSGRPTIGSWISLAHPAIAEIMAKAGFDWLTIDLEHSVITIREAEELIRVVELCGVPPLVRLSSNDAVQIKRVMDAGAHGVIVPMVNTAEDARLAVEAVRYPPKGKRGVGLARAQGYGARFEEYRKWQTEDSVVMVLVEHIKAVKNLDSILDVEGVDGFVIGPYDISASLGLPGKFDHPLVLKALKQAEKTAKKRGALMGYHVVPPEIDRVHKKIAEGYRFIAYSLDMLVLGETFRRDLGVIRGKFLNGKRTAV